MNKFDKYCFKYFVFSIPLILALVAWGAIDNSDELALLTEGYKHYLWDGLGLNFMLWIVTGFYLLAKLLLSTHFRQVFFSHFSSLKAEDEREEQITGEAAKISMIATLALLFFLLFISVFEVKIGRYSKEIVPEGKNGYISIGMNFYPLSKKAQSRLNEIAEGGEEIVRYSGLPFSNSALLVFLVFWQLGFYQFLYKKSKS